MTTAKNQQGHARHASRTASKPASQNLVAARRARHSKIKREDVYSKRERHLDQSSATAHLQSVWGWVRPGQGVAA